MNSTQTDAQAAKPTILIVEDHKAMRTLLRDWLSDTFPGCRFLEARGGEQALALASAYSPDIVLMDIGLPGMSGIEATRRIKASLPQAQVVIVTMNEDSSYQAAAAAAGATAYILKGRAGTQLVPVVEKLLNRGSNSPGE